MSAEWQKVIDAARTEGSVTIYSSQATDNLNVGLSGFATADLTGWTVLESACRGKHLLLRARDAARGVRDRVRR